MELVALLLVSVSCAQDTDEPAVELLLEDFEEAGPFLEGRSVEPLPLPHPEPTNIVQEQRNDVHEEALRASGLAFYLEDKAAFRDGEIPSYWEQPPLDVYKLEPWCHSPVPHGNHLPDVGDLPALVNQERLPPLDSGTLELAAEEAGMENN